MQPEEFFLVLTPRRFSRVVERLLDESAGTGPIGTLRLLYRRRGLRFGDAGAPAPRQARRLFRRWLESTLPALPPDELDMTDGVRRLFERLRFTSALRGAWWTRLCLEVPFPQGPRLHWLLEHQDGRVTRAAVTLEPPASDLILTLPPEDLARLYAVDGRSGLALLLRAARVLRVLRLVRGRTQPRPSVVLRLLRRLVAGGSEGRV